MDRLSKTFLYMIVLLLGVIALRPIINVRPTLAQQSFEYIPAEYPDRGRLEEGLKNASRQGLELVAIVDYPANQDFIVVFKRLKK